MRVYGGTMIEAIVRGVLYGGVAVLILMVLWS